MESFVLLLVRTCILQSGHSDARAVGYVEAGSGVPLHLRVRQCIRVDQAILQIAIEYNRPAAAFGYFLALFTDGDAVLLYGLVRKAADEAILLFESWKP